MTLRPVKKPAKRKQAERAWNSSLPRPQKKLVAKKRLRPVNRKRRASEFARAYGSKARVAFVASLPCVAGPILDFMWFCARRCDNAHIETGGTGRKAGYAKIVPLCRAHHQALHHVGRETFEREFRVDLYVEAARVESLWQEHVKLEQLGHRNEGANG